LEFVCILYLGYWLFHKNMRSLFKKLFFLISILYILRPGVAEAAKLTVPDNLIGKRTLYLVPQDNPPASAQEGQVYFDTDNKLYYCYYCDGATCNWKPLLMGERAVATKIVAASDSLDRTCAGGTCCRADYTCDGVDDQQEINRAINSLPIDTVTGKSYGAVYLLEGTYNISAALLEGETLNGIVLASPHDNTALIGTGRGTVLKIVSGASSVNVINASGVNRILVSQLMITDANTSGTTNQGINFTTVTNSKVDKVWVENIKGNGIYLKTSSNNNTISNSNIQGNSQQGIYLYTSSNNNTVSNNNVQGNTGIGIYLYTSSSNNTISNSNIQGNSQQGIYLYTSSNYNTISGNNVQGNSYCGIYLVSSSNNIISNNNTQTNAHGIDLSSSSNNTISNNNVQGNNWNGINLSSSSRNTITGNVIYESGIVGDPLYQDGIKLNGSNSTNIISSNRIFDSAGSGYGINISAVSCDNNYLSANLIDGAGYTGRLIQDLGSGTKYTDKLKITLEPGSYTIDATPTLTPTGPSGYLRLATGSPVILSGTTAIADGKSIGDLLILEGTSDTNKVTIPNNANTLLGAARILGLEDTLKLIWNGNDWVEAGWSDNSP
jgi:parallel beta-helix repeat protein